MLEYALPDALVARFASNTFSPRLLVSRLLPDDALLRDIDEAIADIPPDVMEDVLTDPVSKVWLDIDKSFASQGGPGRIVFHHLLNREIYRRRSAALQDRGARSKPYDHPALADLEPDTEGLVPLRAFEIGIDGGLTRNGHVFSPTPPLGGVSSRRLRTLCGVGARMESISSAKKFPRHERCAPHGTFTPSITRTRK